MPNSAFIVEHFTLIFSLNTNDYGDTFLFNISKENYFKVNSRLFTINYVIHTLIILRHIDITWEELVQ